MGQTAAEHKKRIAKVIDHILANPAADLSLQSLAGLAHYSPFHLQKIFKQEVGESPKQYLLKLRLETALHLLIIHPHKSIQEIAADSGFSSPAVFSRAMKSYFAHSPGELRELSHRQQMKILHAVNQRSPRPPGPTPTASPAYGPVIVRIVKKESLSGIYRMAPFDDPKKIQDTFRELARIASTLDPDRSTPVLYGILTPHQRNTYKTFLPIRQGAPAFQPSSGTDIKGGLFASFVVQGDLRQTNRAVHYFYQQWLPESGYKIADVAGFETFDGNPATTAYFQLKREIHIPIEPAG